VPWPEGYQTRGHRPCACLLHSTGVRVEEGERTFTPLLEGRGPLAPGWQVTLEHPGTVGFHHTMPIRARRSARTSRTRRLPARHHSACRMIPCTPTAVAEADGGNPATRWWPRRCPTPRHHGVPGAGHTSCALAPDRVVHPCCPSISGCCVVMCGSRLAESTWHRWVVRNHSRGVEYWGSPRCCAALPEEASHGARCADLCQPCPRG
jgi:hypothetical protein